MLRVEPWKCHPSDRVELKEFATGVGALLAQRLQSFRFPRNYVSMCEATCFCRQSLLLREDHRHSSCWRVNREVVDYAVGLRLFME